MIADGFSALEEAGLTQYERRALITLLHEGIADAAKLCENGDIPTSKIYSAMEKLASMHLVEIQPTRPKLYAAMSVDQVIARLIELAHERTRQFEGEMQALREALDDVASKAKAGPMFADLALGSESHVRRHLAHLATARREVVSYMEKNDLQTISASKDRGFNILRRITRNAADRGVRHRVVFGFTHRDAGELIAFLKENRNDISALTGVRYAGLLGHPFHVIDGETVILALDHPFLPEQRFASLLIRSQDLARPLVEGFDRLWTKAMKSLSEIDVHPGAMGRVR
ncbi:MAG: hypothetical protein KF784_12175 [Fimbriimonadaceae bacterium]|nr:hypothetical protein [Fimbriimonadaceae bacterium]